MNELKEEYFYLRDYEYAQMLYDLIFILEIKGLIEKDDISKYRLKSLAKAAFSIDGYSNTISKWLRKLLSDSDLDYIPSKNIKKYLFEIAHNGSIEELNGLLTEELKKTLNLRAIRGLLKKKIAELITVTTKIEHENLLQKISYSRNILIEKARAIYQGNNFGNWQPAHIIPPLIRFLNAFEQNQGKQFKWKIEGISDGLSIVNKSFIVTLATDQIKITKQVLEKTIKKCQIFSFMVNNDKAKIYHKMGWFFTIKTEKLNKEGASLFNLVDKFDPLMAKIPAKIKSDLHMHSIWSDGISNLEELVRKTKKSGLEYIAITDHSRSEKIQNGLTPFNWIKQKNYITKSHLEGRILHGLEVDILRDGSLDMPRGLLNGMDIIIGSIHSGFNDTSHENTERICKAIQNGYLDIIGHPTNSIYGKPGVPNYYRPPINVNWDKVFKFCLKWSVALEINCFPSRLDLSNDLLSLAIKTGCWISLGSDAHSKLHLELIKFGVKLVQNYPKIKLLNHLTMVEIKNWLKNARKIRSKQPKITLQEQQISLFNDDIETNSNLPKLNSTYEKPAKLPKGSSVVGIDLTAGTNKETGIAFLENNKVTTQSLLSDNDILRFIKEKKPSIVSIDSPLGLPGGKKVIEPKAGIVREAEKDLSSVGIPAYPALIDSMKELTLRGIKLKNIIENLKNAPIVIESYPGAAQDILGIPRKQKGLEHLRKGLKQLGIRGKGMDAQSHDEIDAITCCVVGRYFEARKYQPMGIPSEAQLIVPIHPILKFKKSPIIILSGMVGVGKSVTARYLALFYGFNWIQTRDIIKELLLDNFDNISTSRLKIKQGKPVEETHLREFGKIILNEYDQVPLRERLNEAVNNCTDPIVIDSIKSFEDFDINNDNKKLYSYWNIECNERTLFSNRDKRKNIKNNKRDNYTLLDKNIIKMKNHTDVTIKNNSSLESLHWQIDDTLFNKIFKLTRNF